MKKIVTAVVVQKIAVEETVLKTVVILVEETQLGVLHHAQDLHAKELA